MNIRHEQYNKFTGDSEYLEVYEERMKRERDQKSLIHSAEKSRLFTLLRYRA